jgi:hypothetical protein
MTAKTNPYRPPSARADEGAPTAGVLRVVLVFAAWLCGASLLGGAAVAWQTARALEAFGAATLTAALSAVSALRVGGAQAAASAATVALVVATHRRTDAGAELRAARIPSWIYVLVPPAMPIAAALMMGSGALVLAAFGVSAAVSWRRAGELATMGDLLFGVACASLDAVLLGLIAAVAVPRLAGSRAGLFAKIAVALVATGLVGGVVRGALGACVPEDDAGAGERGLSVPVPP